MPDLLTAIEQQNDETVDTLICAIQRDGRRTYLKKVRRNDMRSFFSYLAKSEGRKKVGIVPADATPLIDECGRPVVAIVEKTRLITQAFYERFSAPAVTNPRLSTDDPNNIPLPYFRERLDEPFRPVQLVQVVRANKIPAGNPAPGPDGITATPFQHLPALNPYLQFLYTAMYRTGRIPAPLTKIQPAPLPKPSKDPRDVKSRSPNSLLSSGIKFSHPSSSRELL